MPVTRTKPLRIILVTLAGALIVVCAVTYRHLGMWLVVSDPLPPSLDAIFTFAGDNDRIPYSKRLYLQYPKALWIVSDPTKKILDSLYAEGTDTARIMVVDTCKSTLSEADCIVKRASALPGTAQTAGRSITIGLVSSPYHMRRIRLLVSAQHPDTQVSFVYLPVPFDQGPLSKRDYETWWKNKGLAPAVRLEVNKVVYSMWKGIWE